MGLVSGAIQAIQGVGSALSADKVRKAKNKVYNEQYKTAQMRSEYNEKEIQRAFKENYSRTLYAYGDRVGELSREFNTATDAILTNNVANLSDVDMAGSSFHQTAMQEARKERDDAVRNIVTNQSQALMSLAREKENMRTENKLSLFQAKYQRNLGYLENKAERDVTIVNGITDAIVGLESMYASMPKGEAGAKTETIGEDNRRRDEGGGGLKFNFGDTTLKSPLLDGSYKVGTASNSFANLLGGGNSGFRK